MYSIVILSRARELLRLTEPMGPGAGCDLQILVYIKHGKGQYKWTNIKHMSISLYAPFSRSVTFPYPPSSAEEIVSSKHTLYKENKEL